MKTVAFKECASVFAVALLTVVQLSAQKMMIASGAGYKKPVSEVVEKFQQTEGIKVDIVCGNLQMVASQAKQSDEVACIIGDKRFLGKLKSIISFTDYTKIGKGILVLAYRKGVEINDVADILGKDVHTLFMPQDGKAIYGVAGREALQSLGYYDKVSSKLTQVATVPQVVSYLLTGEADAGFINLTEALANKDKFGGYILVPSGAYNPIEIVAGTVKGFETKETTKQFVSFIQSDKAKAIFTKYGL